MSARTAVECPSSLDVFFRCNFESFLDLWNTPLLGSADMFPKEAVEKTIENQVGFSMMRWFGRPLCKTSCPGSLLRDWCLCDSLCLLNAPFPSPLGSWQGRVLHPPLLLVPKLLLPSIRRRRGEKFWKFLASFSTAGGRCTRVPLGFLEFL